MRGQPKGKPIKRYSDAQKKELKSIMRYLRGGGSTFNDISIYLNDGGKPMANGGTWNCTNTAEFYGRYVVNKKKRRQSRYPIGRVVSVPAPVVVEESTNWAMIGMMAFNVVVLIAFIIALRPLGLVE